MAVQISGNDITVPRDGTFSRNVSIAGTLTYEDVTNVDSIGLVTARNGIEVGASPGVAASISVDGNAIFSGITTIGGNVKVGTGITLSPDGNIFATGVTTSTTFSGSGANLTNIPAANITGTLPAIDGSNLTGVSSPAANRNFIINGAMRFWQRGTSFNSQGNGQNDYTTDRFAIGHNNSHMAAVTQQDGTGADAKFQYCARVQRDSGNSQTDQMRFHTALETNDVILLRGETLTISYYARKGANYSEANSQITGVRIATGENTDGDPNAYSGGSWTNASTILTGTPTLTTSWQRFSHTTSAVSSSANSMIIEFRNTPVGTAGANDYYEITGVQLEIGSSATAFEHRKYTDEFQSCQRFYQDIPANTSVYVPMNGSYARINVLFPTVMRSAPSITLTPSWEGGSTTTHGCMFYKSGNNTMPRMECDSEL